MPLEEKGIEEHKNAIAKTEAAVQNNPTNFEAHIELGMAYFHAAQFEKALLEIALTKGQVKPGWAQIDPEFAFMTDYPQFKTLVQE